MGKFTNVGIVRRKCMVWSRKTEAGGWDCEAALCTISLRKGCANSIGIIKCDPPVSRVLTDYTGNVGYNFSTMLYNAGYVDFMPYIDLLRNRSSPPKTSLFEDLIFYF